MNQNENSLFYLIEQGKDTKFIERFNPKKDCNKISAYNQSLLQNAISEKQLNIAEFLIKNNCNINHQDNNGYTALDYILTNRVCTERYYLIEMLLDLDVRLDFEDKKYRNQPLFEAVRNPKIPLELIEKFLKKGANPHHKNIAGISPYDMVVKFNIPELTEIFRPYI
ncbi:ankyrin repeat domain-containing protein [Sulfurovum sp.]|jgi:ankyrin repeat protein|uniref:ankyrin repeat domain-containing protein n=1 Tax=Sulfurovum sp. TaxID=1969726 RepID=UPI002A35A2BD|nr:ankyrin repeat domain-containing protein [Sulfurovum sp.]MDY0403609.1 ankyrin repeat domain-containing protein [Sulfurovum sp.]